MFSDIYTPSRDGVRTSIEEAKKSLEAAGHTVVVVTPSVPGWRDKERGVVRLASMGNPVTPTTAPTFRVALPYPGLVGKVDRAVGKVDVIHSHTQGILGLLAWLVARRKGVPLVHTVHGFMYEIARKTPGQMMVLLGFMTLGYPPFLALHGVKRGRYRLPKMPWAERAMLKLLLDIMTLADELVVPSPHVAKRLVGYGVKLPIAVVPSVIDQADFKHPPALPPSVKLPPRRAVRFLSVSRVSAEKRIEQLVEALGLLPRDEDWDAVIVGDGPSLAKCREMAAKLQIGDRVMFTGSQPNSVVASIMAECDVFVLSSWHFDTQALTILESLAAGLAIVYCDDLLTVGLTPESALLTEKSPQGMATGMEQLLRDRTRLNDMKAAGLVLAKDFEQPVMGQNLIKAYESIKSA